jgi:hypothetical protein
MQALVADIITSRIDELNLQMPKLSEDQRQKLNVARAELVAEKE